MSEESIQSRVDRLELPFNAYGVDPYGISKRHLVIGLTALAAAYRRYFHVWSVGVEHVPARGRAMLIGNHSGGVAIDGAMVIASMFLEMNPPRLAQGMAEKFINRLPFASNWTARTGQFTGLPETAERLLRDERLLMVFPEGARGTAKLYKDRWSLVAFGTGFMRLAMKTGTPIVPFGFIGGGDAIPTVANLYGLGKLVGAPYIPVTPYLLPLPRPVPLEVHYGRPMLFEGTGSEDDEVVARNVEQVKQAIAQLIEEGRAHRRDGLARSGR
jgi:1-acyl-sn-glycerol-3-phosphate acyltransferase